jgi:hypothetical protein
MGEPHTSRTIINESKYPYIVELAVDTDELSVELSRRMLHFHKSRNIHPRHGRRIIRETQIYFRWCFSESATARAFIEQFGGEILQPEHLNCWCRDKVRRIATNIAKLPDLLTPPRWVRFG